MDGALVITVKDFLLFILWMLLCGVLIYVILILSKAYLVVKSIGKIVTDNKPHIDSTLEVVPNLTKNVADISGEVAHDIQAFRPTVDNIAETSANVTGKLNENSGLVSGIGSFVHTISIGKALYDKYFGNKYQATIEDIKDTLREVNDTIRDLEDK
ncbi:MAG: hypothetical protein Q4A52_04800 [Bacillota bacterium]|nr:hypothetical protein [Bacillota bacterium]